MPGDSQRPVGQGLVQPDTVDGNPDHGKDVLTR